jgi:hypothetical protein
VSIREHRTFRQGARLALFGAKSQSRLAKPVARVKMAFLPGFAPGAAVLSAPLERAHGAE